MSLKQVLKTAFIASGFTKKVGLFIVGAEKSSTTSVHNTLCQHPHIKEGRHKEAQFWNPNAFEGPKTIKQYRSLFPLRTHPNDLLIDSTPDYLNHPQIAGQIRNYNPSAKFIILLRDPIERIKSAHRMYHTSFPASHQWRGCEVHDPRELDEAIQQELSGKFPQSLPAYFQRPIYINCSRYATHLQHYVNQVPKHQLRIFIVEEDLHPQPALFFKSIFEWLNLQEMNVTLEHSNKSKKLDQPAISMNSSAVDILRGEANATRALLNRPISAWNI